MCIKLTLKKGLFGLTMGLTFVFAAVANNNDLKSNFYDPPAEYSLIPLWSWNGTLEPNKLKWQIDQMMEKGIYGAFMHARAGINEGKTPYFSEGWWEAVDTTLAYSSRVGFQAYLYDEDKWPSGSAGGRTVATNPDEYIKKGLHYEIMEILGEQKIELNFDGEIITILAAELTDKGLIKNQMLTEVTSFNNKIWYVPEGKWIIIAFSLHRNPGIQIDYLDKNAVRAFLDITHEEYYKRYSKHFGKTIPGVFFDEIYLNPDDQNRNLIWTDDFLEEFEKIKGYNLKPYLPLLIYKAEQNTAKIRSDYFDVVSELYTNAWFKQYAIWVEDHNIWLTGHTGERFDSYFKQGDYFKTMGQLQIPCADNEDFRYGFPRMINWYPPKQMSSVAHVYGHNRVAAEAMGGGGYGIPLSEYKYGIGMLASYGINFFIPHLFHYGGNTPRTQADWPPSWFFRNPYWKYFKPLADYGRRISYIMSQGHHICDVALLQPLSSQWVDGYDRTIPETEFMAIQKILLDNLIDYDIIDPGSLLQSDVTKGKITIFEENYKMIILPGTEVLRKAEAEKLKSLVDNGGIVLSTDPLPSKSMTGSEDDGYIRYVVKDIFDIDPTQVHGSYFSIDDQFSHFFRVNEKDGKGKGIFTKYIHEIPTIIHKFINADFNIINGDIRALNFIRHKVDNKDIYYFMNEFHNPGDWLIKFNNRFKSEFWDPASGKITPVTNYVTSASGEQVIAINLGAFESIILVFDSDKVEKKEIAISKTNVLDARLSIENQKKFINGWVSNTEKLSAEFISDNLITYGINKEIENSIEPIILDGKWKFIMVPSSYDYNWSSDVTDQKVTMPVMQFAFLNNKSKSIDFSSFDHLYWKEIKIEDLYNKKTGCQRYLSNWEANWITYYPNQHHLLPMGGGVKWFRKFIDISDNVKSLSIDMTADKYYELHVNGALVGSDGDWKTVEHYNITNVSNKDIVEIVVNIQNTKGLLLQGKIQLSNGDVIKISSDDSWETSEDKIFWQNAFNYAYPPLGSWGMISRTNQPIEFPVSLIYKQKLPPGAKALKIPNIKGVYEIYVNGKQIKNLKEYENINITEHLQEKDNTVLLRVEAEGKDFGLLEPLVILCQEEEIELTEWKNLNIDWYSGRGVYQKNMNIPADYLNTDTRLFIDLGEVNYAAEVWVNDKLVSFHPWAPFKTEITNDVSEGQNEITIVVANLLVNRARWNILDENIDNSYARWWHDGTIMREPDKLTSGLIGPVKVLPFTPVKVRIDEKSH